MTSDLGVWHIAAACHEAHRRVCIALAESVPPVWEDAPIWMRHNAMDSVRIQLENPGITHADRHKKWMDRKIMDGWRLGEKDPDAKTHPCLVPFAELPDAQQMKGRLFGRIVESLRDVR